METPLKGINRRQFLSSTAAMAAVPAWVGSREQRLPARRCPGSRQAWWKSWVGWRPRG